MRHRFAADAFEVIHFDNFPPLRLCVMACALLVKLRTVALGLVFG